MKDPKNWINPQALMLAIHSSIQALTGDKVGGFILVITFCKTLDYSFHTLLDWDSLVHVLQDFLWNSSEYWKWNKMDWLDSSAIHYRLQCIAYLLLTRLRDLFWLSHFARHWIISHNTGLGLFDSSYAGFKRRIGCE